MAEDDLPEIYTLETIDQMRAMADELRLRILQLLGHAAMTATEIGKQLGVPANKTHYHVRELDRVGLVRLVETREKGGVLEKYYRAVAHDFTIPGSLLGGATADEGLAFTGSLLQSMAQGFQQAARTALQQPDESRDPLSLSSASLWLTRDEHRDLVKRIAALLEPFEYPRDTPDAREHTFAVVDFVTPPRHEPTDMPPRSATTPAKPRRHTIFTAGATGYSRADLERIASSSEQVDLHALGLLTFAADIPADLVERAIGRFRHRGKLIASPEVRAVLAQKEQRKEP